MFLNKYFFIIFIFLYSCSSSESVKNLDKKEEKTKYKISNNYYLLDNKLSPFSYNYPQITKSRYKKNEKDYVKKYDFNSDGIIDMLMVYKNNILQEIISDLDFDNQYDVIDEYKNNKIYKRKIFNHINKKPYIWIYYNKDKISRKEVDFSLNGKVDQIYIYENSFLKEKRLDTNGDGVFDKIEHYKINKEKR